MEGNKVIAASVLIVIILCSIVFTVKRQFESPRIPDWVLEQQHRLILAKSPWTIKEFTYRLIRKCPIDSETGYRVIDGELWAQPMRSAEASEKAKSDVWIPIRPRPVQSEVKPDEDYAAPYKCPRTGMEANPIAWEAKKEAALKKGAKL